MLNELLEKKLLDKFKTDGYCVLPSFFDQASMQNMKNWVEEIAKWPSEEGRQLNYYEKVNDKIALSRTENFLPFHAQLKNLIEKSDVFAIMEKVIGEPVLLFKEKINYKYQGTGKYNPHQDIHAFDTSPLAFQDYHVNCAIFVDEATIENGCFEIVPGYKDILLDRNQDGSIVSEVADKLDWQPLEVSAGTVVIFDCWIPHKSEKNLSNNPRRSIYLTFNGVSNGDLRQAHYEDRASGKAVTREINPDLFVEKALA